MRKRQISTRHDAAGLVFAALLHLGGKGTTNEVYLTVASRFPFVTRIRDYKYALRWARHVLVARGVMRDDSPRGIWELAV